MEKKNKKFRAVVIGHTGATGKALLDNLLSNPNCESIVAIGRRENEEYKNSKKLKQFILKDMLEIGSFDIEKIKGFDSAFCCIGLPFNDVFKKSKADSYRAVDFGIATEFAKLVDLAGVQFFSIITGTGTDSNSSLHMVKVKGQVEDFVKTLNFERIAFIRPGFLNRGADATWQERLMLPGIFGIPVSQVAQSMIWASLYQTDAIAGYSNKEIKSVFKKLNESK